MKAEVKIGMVSIFCFFIAHLSLRSLGEFDRCNAEYSRNGLLRKPGDLDGIRFMPGFVAQASFHRELWRSRLILG